MRRLMVAGAVLVLAACGGSSAKTVTSTSSSTSTTTKPGAAAIPDPTPALLTVQDLPTGWATSVDTNPGRAGFCNSETVDQRAGTARRAAGRWTGEPSSGPILAEEVFAFPSTTAAKTFMTRSRTVATACQQWIEQSDGKPVTAVPSAMSFPTLGDDTIATQVQLKSQGQSAYGDYIWVRHGSTVVGLVLGGFSVDTDQLTTFTQTAVAKAAGLSAGN